MKTQKTRFIHQNKGWNAEPNAPFESVSPDGPDLVLTFLLNPYLFEKFEDGDTGFIRFRCCSRYRFTDINDEAWIYGHCRFSRLAPDWGEFYEVAGDFKESLCPQPWQVRTAPPERQRNFLFYFRDRTFECSARDWIFERLPENALLK